MNTEWAENHPTRTLHVRVLHINRNNKFYITLLICQHALVLEFIPEPTRTL